jgi:TolA-binding protein
VWSLDGESLGLLDPVAGLARGYELSSPGGATTGTGASGAKEHPWNFKIDVEARAAKDRSVTQQVMTTLQDMAKQKASRQAQIMQMRQQQQMQQQQQQMLQQQQQQQQQLAAKSESHSLAASARDRSAPVSTRGTPSE